ncbi:MAG: peptidylprolyl isomerase [Bacteroidota bacterium]|nr:peptidylprolyl isomerase [Bacteroidota bacterium]MDP3144963.1 peptidylprolyl isomerase [Bacteroidota bacterium]
MKNIISLILAFSTVLFSAEGQTLSKETVLIETNYGKIKVKLYEETPLHKANFLKLVQEKVYDSLLFHRVINDFMVQGGDLLSKRAKAGDSLGHGDMGYSIPAEFNSKLIHKKGGLAAARESDDINPKFESSASQFYIVKGKIRSIEDLKKNEERINKTYYTNCARKFMKSEEGMKLKQKYSRLKAENKEDSTIFVNAQIEAFIKTEYVKKPEYKFNKEQIDAYTSVGGTPHLDGTYTVFGEVIEGLDVLDKIIAVNTDKRDRPIKDIRMKMSVIK